MSRTEEYYKALLEGTEAKLIPRSRKEAYLKNCCDKCGCDGLPAPRSREEALLYQLAEKLAAGGGGDDTNSYILLTQDGQEIPAVLVGEETVFDATANDIREGKTAATESGVTVGTKVIPSYNTSEGWKIIPAGSAVKITSANYEYTKLQALICAFNTSSSNSVATEKVAIDGNVYNVLSVESLSLIEKDGANTAINFGVTNDTDKPQILRYFYYKEIY